MAEVLMFGRYLQETRGQPFEWGRSDCVMWATGALVAATGHDPFADLRGTYATEDEANKIMAREGGMVALFDKRMARVSADDGVVIVRVLGRLTAAIASAGKIICKTERGLVFLPFRPVGLWV